ncbi:MAG: alpha/beta hydrolase [Anaerolineae bacterium]|nr:alpha/beta hydrolase [Anaerolineae bacterium]
MRISGLVRWLLVTGGVVTGWLAYSATQTNRSLPIGLAVPAGRKTFYGPTSAQLSYYEDTAAAGRPLVLLHSINAAASVYEMRPLFEHYRAQRPVYALDLPGFGFSERSNRDYSIDLYTNAIVDFLRHIGGEPADVIALSLTSEFAARAALYYPDLFHSLTVISPTGLGDPDDSATLERAQAGGLSETVYKAVSSPVWSQGLYNLLTMRPGIHFFLGQSFAGKMDAGMADYAYLVSHQPGARYAPLAFLSGRLFSPRILEQVYQKLSIPAMVLYDTDPNVGFDRLPALLEASPHWRARRIPNTRGLPHFERMGKVAEALGGFWSELPA